MSVLVFCGETRNMIEENAASPTWKMSLESILEDWSDPFKGHQLPENIREICISQLPTVIPKLNLQLGVSQRSLPFISTICQKQLQREISNQSCKKKKVYHNILHILHINKNNFEILSFTAYSHLNVCIITVIYKNWYIYYFHLHS